MRIWLYIKTMALRQRQAFNSFFCMYMVTCTYQCIKVMTIWFCIKAISHRIGPTSDARSGFFGKSVLIATNSCEKNEILWRFVGTLRPSDRILLVPVSFIEIVRSQNLSEISLPLAERLLELWRHCNKALLDVIFFPGGCYI